MNENFAIAKMIPPGRRRLGIWRSGVMQIFITRSCDKACFHCTQNSQLSGKANRITLEQFERALQSLRGYFGVYGIFGGNPALHPEFPELCRLLQQYVPFEQRGLWCNKPFKHAAIMAETFNPAVSNLNVHQDAEAWQQFADGWPSCIPYLKGLESDSRHGPPLVAMQDVLPDESERWRLISNCDVNQKWSAMICPVRGELRAFVCELMGAQAMLHQDNPNWMGTGKPMPDVGLPVTDGWWKKPIMEFKQQIKLHCHACGIPLKGYGALANAGPHEQVSKTHVDVFKPKDSSRPIEIVSDLVQLGEQHLPRATDYLENSAL